MKKIKKLIIGISCLMPTVINAEIPIDNGTCIKVEFSCQKIRTQQTNEGFHRTPPQIPNVYFDSSTSTVYFENPCYECTLELVIPESDAVVYTSSIEDGAETFQIPNGFTGTYELHIHRGNYCFYGEIEL